MKTLAAAAIALTTAFAGTAIANKTKPVKGQDLTTQTKVPASDATSRAKATRSELDPRYVDPNAGVRDLSPELANWLSRSHSRPAGR